MKFSLQLFEYHLSVVGILGEIKNKKNKKIEVDLRGIKQLFSFRWYGLHSIEFVNGFKTKLLSWYTIMHGFYK